MSIGKRGSTVFNILIHVLRTIMLIIVFVAITATAFYILGVTFAPERQELQLLAYRLLYAPGGLSQYDPLTNRVMPGVLDLQQMETGQWAAALDFAKPYLAAQVTLRDASQQELWRGQYDPDHYRLWAPLRGISGKGSVVEQRVRLPVLIEKGALDILVAERERRAEQERLGEKPAFTKPSLEKLEAARAAAGSKRALVPAFLEIHLVKQR